MQLKNHEDNTDTEFVGSECKVRFHFFFELLKPKEQRNDKERSEWNINENPQ